jgi:hypothetical protein
MSSIEGFVKESDVRWARMPTPTNRVYGSCSFEHNDLQKCFGDAGLYDMRGNPAAFCRTYLSQLEKCERKRSLSDATDL